MSILRTFAEFAISKSKYSGPNFFLHCCEKKHAQSNKKKSKIYYFYYGIIYFYECDFILATIVCAYRFSAHFQL